MRCGKNETVTAELQNKAGQGTATREDSCGSRGLSMVVPVLGEAKALKAEKLLATVEKTEPFYDDFVRLSKELEGKSADEAVRILSKEKGVAGAGSYLENLAIYKQLFKEGKITELFSELKKTTAFPKFGKTKVRNHTDLEIEYKTKYGENATNYPYSKTNPVTDFELDETGYFVRVYSGTSTNSSWIFRIEDLRQYGSVDEYVEFENTIAFLLKKNNFRHKIVGVRFSQEGGINHFLISWEFQIIDGLKEVHEIVLMERVKFNNKEVIYCYGWGFDICYYLDPDTGEVVHTEPIR